MSCSLKSDVLMSTPLADAFESGSYIGAYVLYGQGIGNFLVPSADEVFLCFFLFSSASCKALLGRSILRVSAWAVRWIPFSFSDRVMRSVDIHSCFFLSWHCTDCR